jgi:hypothetical protein
MAIHPTVALAVTPGRIRVSPLESCRYDPLLLLLPMPDRPARVDHHLVSTDHLLASRPVEKFDECLLHLFSAESRFFLNALVTDFLRSEVL